MGLNVKYVKSVVAILKIASIVLGVLAYSVGMNAYINSEYNRGCREGTSGTVKTSPPTFATTPTTTQLYASTTATTPTTTTSPTTTITSNSSENTPDGVSSPTTLLPLDPETEEPHDKLPILWMERFHLFASGLCTFLAIITFIAILVKEDLLDNKRVRGFDFGFHFVGIIWLLIGAIFMAYTASKIEGISDELCSEDVEKCQLYVEKLTSAGLSFLQALCFAAICVKGYGQKLYQKMDP